MKLYKPIIAGLVAALLFGLLLFDREQTLQRRFREVTFARIIPFDFTTTDYVKLQNEHGTFTMEKRGEEWWITEPVEIPADAAQVRTLVDNLHASKKTSSLDANNLEEYGLANPSPTVTVRGEIDGERESITVLLGGDTNRIGRLYAMIEGNETAFTVGDWIRNQALVNLGHLRDKSLLRFSPEAAQAITINTREESFTIEQRGDQAQWWMAELDIAARQQFVQRTLATLATATATSVVDETTTSTAALGFNKPVLRLEIETQDGSMHHLAIGDRVEGADQFYVQTTAQTIATVRASLLTPLFAQKYEWGTHQMIWMPEGQYSRIETSSGSRRMVLNKNESGVWQFGEFPGIEVHDEKRELAFDAWANLTAEKFLGKSESTEQDAENYGIRDESYTVRIMGDDGNIQGFVLGTSDPADQTGFMKRLQDNTIWKVDARQLPFIRAFRSDLQDKRIQHGFAEEAARIVYCDLRDNVQYILEQENNVWRLRIADSLTAIVPALQAQELLNSIEEIEWDSITVTEQEPEPKVRLDIFDAQGNRLHWFEELASDSATVTIRTPTGIFDVRRDTYANVVQKWAAMLQSSQFEQQPPQ